MFDSVAHFAVGGDGPTFETMADLMAYIDTRFPGIVGRPGSRTVDGYEYEGIFECHVCRAADVEVMRRFVLQRAAARLISYLEPRTGPVHWRIRLEEDQQKVRLVTKYHAGGEHIDFATDRRFSDDGNEWRALKFYCRVWRADLPPVPPHYQPEFSNVESQSEGQAARS